MWIGNGEIGQVDCLVAMNGKVGDENRKTKMTLYAGFVLDDVDYLGRHTVVCHR